MLTGMSRQDGKVRENRLRRMAERQGLRLEKSRRRDPRALDYDRWYILDTQTRTVIAGLDAGRHAMTLGQVEAFLTRGPGPDRQTGQADSPTESTDRNQP
jgi:hypothetical protein